MTESYVQHIAGIEIPVTDLEESIVWYEKHLSTSLLFKTEHTAMLKCSVSNFTGYPTLYLVETTDKKPLAFTSSYTNITHSVIDFYVPLLQSFHSFLLDNGILVSPLNVSPEGLGGFGFKDPSGNSFGATNIVHTD